MTSDLCFTKLGVTFMVINSVMYDLLSLFFFIFSIKNQYKAFICMLSLPPSLSTVFHAVARMITKILTISPVQVLKPMITFQCRKDIFQTDYGFFNLILAYLSEFISSHSYTASYGLVTPDYSSSLKTSVYYPFT